MDFNPRITEGELKNFKLRVPSVSKPLTERVKMTIFNIIREKVGGSKVLDIFAGSGNFGIEALSRGAAYVEFVDFSDQACEVIKDNLQRARINPSKYLVQNMKFEVYAKKQVKDFDIIFADPPFEYEEKYNYSLMQNLLKPNGILIIKTSSNFLAEKRFKELKINYKKILGRNKIYFLSI